MRGNRFYRFFLSSSLTGYSIGTFLHDCRDWLGTCSNQYKTALLYTNLDEELNIDQPEGHIDPEKEYHVYRLHKAVFGLRQAPRAFQAFMLLLFEKCAAKKFGHDS